MVGGKRKRLGYKSCRDCVINCLVGVASERVLGVASDLCEEVADGGSILDVP